MIVNIRTDQVNVKRDCTADGVCLISVSSTQRSWSTRSRVSARVWRSHSAWSAFKYAHGFERADVTLGPRPHFSQTRTTQIHPSKQNLDLCGYHCVNYRKRCTKASNLMAMTTLIKHTNKINPKLFRAKPHKGPSFGFFQCFHGTILWRTLQCLQ